MILDDVQSGAVDLAARALVVVITGGPGTGKTTVCRSIVARWMSDSPGASIALCAPTGKASRRLSEQTGRDAHTIHRLLGAGPTGFRGMQLPYTHYIIDEASMLDVELAAQLMRVIAPGSHVVLVGDVDQLPPVGPGNVLSDLISCRHVHTVRLSQIYRQNEHSHISSNASLVITGKRPVTDDPLSNDFAWVPVDGASDVVASVVGLARRHEGEDVQVLCPQRTGTCGVEALNAALRDAINPSRGSLEVRSAGTAYRAGDRVMHVKNNYNLSVVNGEVGCVTSIRDGGMSVYYGDRTVDYTTSDASELRHCYATTIHKSQGSEYSIVIVVVHSSHSYMLSRRLLYTAITRGKTMVYLVGDDKGLRRAVRNADDSRRNTGLRVLLDSISQTTPPL